MPQVCAVVDAAELCRNTHPDRKYIAAADKAYLDLTTYLSVRSVPSKGPCFMALRKVEQGTFRKDSGKIQGTLREHSLA